MDPAILYSASVLGAVVLYVLLRPGRRTVKMAAAIIGIGLFAGVLAAAGQALAGDGVERPELFFTIFSLIAIASAVRMITHTRPVYSALYFIMVVLSSAALFLLLGAEFMAFALIIVYAGAILITYVFVLMLAHQAPNPDDPLAQPEYDRAPREPAAAATVGFIMLALLGTMIFRDVDPFPPAPPAVESDVRAWRHLDGMPDRLRSAVAAEVERFDWPPNETGVGWTDGGHLLAITPSGEAYVEGTVSGGTEIVRVSLPRSAQPQNVQRVGLDLLLKFPVSLELAGVILLMAMFGAVVLARRQIELSEDELRAAAGMGRMGFADEAGEGGTGGES